MEVETEEGGKAIAVQGGGCRVVFGYVPSMLDTLRKNEAWEVVYAAVKPLEGVQELMKEHVLEKFHSVAAETISRLEICGLDIDEMAEEMGARGDYVNSTLNALFQTRAALLNKSE